MTVLGKILVILHFILSLVAAALFVMVYAVHTNWKVAYDGLKKEYDVAVASAKAYNDEAAAARSVNEAKVQQKQEELDAKIKELQVQKSAVETAQTALIAAQADVKKQGLTIQADAAQKKAQAEEVKRLEMANLAQADQIKKVLENNNDLRKDKVNADIQKAAFEEMNQGLEKRVRELEETVKKAKQSGVVLSGGSSAADNPPPEDVQGVVKKDADAGGLVLVSIGTDAGIVKGHTLEVFRLGATPKYLGKIRIIETHPYESVGQVIGKANGPILKDDHVASKLLK
ncbi:MAG TPA: hypothetical protein VGG61_12175 [Gemmataceae bacterium]|jgi:hypothetical protein